MVKEARPKEPVMLAEEGKPGPDIRTDRDGGPEASTRYK
jgi:hypothetical protein